MNIRDEIDRLEKSNDWIGIYTIFTPIETLQQREEWTDARLLSNIGFAGGMLAKVSTDNIPRRDPDKREFLDQKSKYRQASKILRQRCIELEPNNATYIANLAYLHYQSAIELKQPRGRRDGNVRKEAEEAIKYYDQALAVAQNRIKELYRKGYLLAEILPNTYWRDRNFNLGKQRRLEGIESFQSAIQIWQSLDVNNRQQKQERARCHNEYVKSLYCTGSAYCEMIINKWDEAVFALGLRGNIHTSNRVTYNRQDLENANKSRQYFQNCWMVDRPDGEAATRTVSFACEGVDKLYSLGKIAFAQYWILSGNGQKKDEDVPEATQYRDEAEHYLNEALRFSWSPEKQQQKKDYIAERLARIYISKGEYQQAVEVIEEYQAFNLDPYIIHTLALALMLLGRHEEAQKKLQEAVNNRFNLAKRISHFLIGCSLLREDRLSEALQEFQKAKHIKITDALLFGEALISYKSNEKDKALELIKQANEINPYRISIGKYLERWSEGKIHPMKPT